MNQIVQVKTSTKEYEVIIGGGLHYGEEIAKVKKPCKVVVVSDDIVFSLYGEKCVNELKACGYEVLSFVFPNGEKSKNLSTAEQVLSYCAENGVSKSDLLVALGGGVTGDLTGFVASVFLRGMEYVQCPTTLLAAIDSSVGGKTAVDLPQGKNLVGAFHQPLRVVCDTDTFKTLPAEVFSDGMAEAVKYGMIRDLELFEQFEKKEFDMAAMVQRCVQIKADIVGEDEFDTGVRKLLNFGHTVGHSIEKLSNYEVPHGSAVAIGMVVVTKAYEKANGLDNTMSKRLIQTLKNYNLPISCEYTLVDLAEQAISDKKRAGKKISVLLPETIGNSIIQDMTMDEWIAYIVNSGI